MTGRRLAFFDESINSTFRPLRTRYLGARVLCRLASRASARRTVKTRVGVG